MVHFVYALVLTPFERDLLKNWRGDWNFISSKDFPIHAFCCTDTKEFLFFGDNVKNDTAQDINQFCIALSKAGVTYDKSRPV